MRPLIDPHGDDAHHDTNDCCVFDDDSKLLSCNKGGEIRAWHLQTGQVLYKMDGHNGPVHAVEPIECDGECYALSCGDDGTFKLWDLHSAVPGQHAECVLTQVAHTDQKGAVAVYEAYPVEYEGRWRVLTCGADSAKMWTLPKFDQLGKLDDVEMVPDAVLKGHKGDVLSGQVFVGGDGQLQALTGSKDNLLKLWDLTIIEDKVRQEVDDKGKPVPPRDLQGHDGLIYGCEVSPDGTQALSCSGDRKIKLWELGKQTCLRTLMDTAQVNRCSFISSTSAVTASKDCTSIWDLTSGEVVRKLYGQDDVRSCCLYDNGTRLVTCGSTRMIVLDPSAISSTLQIDAEEHPMDEMFKMVDADGSGSLDLGEIKPILEQMGRAEMVDGKMVVTDDIIKAAQKELDADGDGTIDAKEFEVWYKQQPERKVKRGHESVVKEITQFPDKANSNVLSCAYDGSVKVWDMKTGDILKTLEYTHGEKTQVFEVCGFPDNKQILTCGGDATVKVWDWESGNCNATLVGHTSKKNPVRGCGVFACGKKAFSCSGNGEIKIWQLTVEGTTVTGGSVLLSLDGHKGLVDRCCLYDNDKKLISASWDKTLRVWDIETGKLIHTLKDHNKARGVSVYHVEVDKEMKLRAVSTGSGLTLSIWDLDAGTLVKRIETGHTATVWGLEVIDDREMPQADGKPAEKPMAITWSNDRAIKVWNLEHEQEREVVAARRQVKPGPMCLCVLPASYALGTFPMLVGGFRSIQLVDVSNVGTGPSGGALWACHSTDWSVGGAELEAWNEWLLAAIQEESPHFMYARERESELPTLIHKLASLDHGHVLLSLILEAYKQPRKAFLQGTHLGDAKQQHTGAATIGLVSRAGVSESRGNPLLVATEAKNESMVDLLLKDYCAHIECFKWKIERDAAVTEVQDVTEDDVCALLETFPQLAIRFLMDLPMRRTALISDSAHCDFTDVKSGRLIEAVDDECSVLTSTKGASYWGEQLEKQWETSPLRNKDPKIKSIHDDSAWGVKVQSFVLPIEAGGGIVEHDTKSASDQADDASISKPAEKPSGEYEALVDASSVERSTVLDRAADAGAGPKRHHSSDKPAFSALLEAAVNYAEEHDNPDIFLSPTLEAIVQFKWDGRCHVMYNSLFFAYCIHIVLLTWVTLYFDRWQFDVGGSTPDDFMGSGQGDTMGLSTADDWAQTKRVAIWSGYVYVTIYNMALIKHELHQLVEEGLAYFGDPYNVIDSAGAGLSMYCLVAMVTGTGDQHSHEQLMLDVCQAQMMIFTWFKVLYFLRGLDQTAFLVKCLVQICSDIKYFILVLVVILMAFGASFFLLLRFGSDGDGDENFASVPMSFVSVYDMTFGAFNISWFRNAPNLAFIAIVDFMLFMLVVPTIMLNALIAIMSDTYTKTKNSSLQTNRKERADIILELESQMEFVEGAPMPHDRPVMLILRTLFSMKIKFPDYPRNLHLLQPATEDVEEEDATLLAVTQLDHELAQMKIQLHKLEDGHTMVDHSVKDLNQKMDHLIELVNKAVAEK